MNLPALLQELVAIESPSGQEGAAADYAARLLASRGIEVERLGDSLLARCAPLRSAGSRSRGPGLLLNSHLDTVPVGQGWTQRAVGAEWADGRLYGRGANDAKASAAAMLWTIVHFAESARSSGSRGTLYLALTACEETSNAGMGAVLARLEREGPGLAAVVHGAVTGEPTGLEVVRAQSGLAVLRAVWSGRSCHAAHVARVPHANALLVAARELSAIDSHLTLGPPHPLIGASTLAPTVLEAGRRHNVVPDRAEALFDARLAPPNSAAEAVALLQRALPSASIEIHSERLKPVETAAEHPLVRAALKSAGRALAIGSNTLSDMALLRGIPAVKCGPGETARSHTPDEFVLRDELEAGAAFYGRLGPAAFEALGASAHPAGAAP